MLNTILATAIAATMTVTSVVAGFATGRKDNDTSIANTSTVTACTDWTPATIHTDIPDLVIVADQFAPSSEVSTMTSSERTADLPDIIVTARAIGSDLAASDNTGAAIQF